MGRDNSKSSTKTARQHVEAILAGEPKIPYAVGGAKSEQNWREEFRAAGLPVLEPEVMDSTTTARAFLRLPLATFMGSITNT